MSNATRVQGQPPLLHQPPRARHRGVGIQDGGEPFSLLQINTQRRLQPQRQPSISDEDVGVSPPDDLVEQLAGDGTSVLLVELTDGNSTGVESVQTGNQGSHSESTSFEGDDDEMAAPIANDASEGEQEDGDMEDEGEQPPAPPPPPGSPLDETQAVPCIHEPVQRQNSGTLIEEPLALSMDEIGQ